MMKKNTILKILSFVLVLTMVVAAVLLTGCGNKKEDPKASQAELDAAKAALEAAQAEIAKIQENLDKMTKDGSATADDLKKAQDELEAAKKALEDLTQASTSEEVYNALYGEDSDKTLAKYQAKVVELADAKRNIEYIVNYGTTINLPDDRKDWNEANYAAFLKTPVGAVEAKCLAWMASRLALATSTKVVDQVWADMEAAFAGIQKIVDLYDAELASLLPDANGGKLTLIKEDKDGNKIDQLADLKSYHDWIIANKDNDITFNGATKEKPEPKKAEYEALVEAYAKLLLVDKANDAAIEEFVTDYGTEEISAIQYEHKTVDGKIVETDKVANETLGKFFTNFVLYYEVTIREKDADGKPVDNVYVYSTADYDKFKVDAAADTYTYTYKYLDGETVKTNTLVFGKTDGKLNGKYYKNSVSEANEVTVKAFTFADIFNVDANADAKYYVAVDVAKDLSANATYFARKARYEELDAAKAEFATIYTKQLSALKALEGALPLMTDISKIEDNLATLAAWQEKYDLADGELIDTRKLTGEAKAKAIEANEETVALNAVKDTVRKQIFVIVDNGAKAFGGDSSAASYANIAKTIVTVKALKEIQAELVTPEVKGTSMSLSALFESWKTNVADDVKFADYETYKDVLDRIEGYETKDEDNKDKYVPGIYDLIYGYTDPYDTDVNTQKHAALYPAEQRVAAYEAMIGQTGTNRTIIDNLLYRAKLLKAVSEEMEKVAVAFRDEKNLTKVAKSTDNLTGKETTTYTNSKDKVITVYWDIDFDQSNEIDTFKTRIADTYKDTYGIKLNGVNKNLKISVPAEDETGVGKDNYDLITKTAKEFLAQAIKAFDAKKLAYQNAYAQVKDVIYSVEENTSTKKNELVKVDTAKLQNLANILWAKGVIAEVEKDSKIDFTEKVDDEYKYGNFVVESIKLNETDTTNTVITYGQFREDLNDAVKAMKSLASRAEVDAKKIVKVITDSKLATYTSLNQNPAVLSAVGKTTVDANGADTTTEYSFRAWCKKYLGVALTEKVKEFDEDTNTEVEKWVVIDNETFFETVAKYFVTAKLDGTNTDALLGIDSTYAFISVDNFKILKDVDVASAAKYEAAKTAFLNLKWKPEDAYVTDVEGVNEAFVNYVATYYQDGNNNRDFWEYYMANTNNAAQGEKGYYVLKDANDPEKGYVNALESITDEDKFKKDSNQTLITKLRGAETVEEKTIRFASYIHGEGTEPAWKGTTYYKADGTTELGNDATAYKTLKAFNGYYYAVEKDPSTANLVAFFDNNTEYDEIGVTSGVYPKASLPN